MARPGLKLVKSQDWNSALDVTLTAGSAYIIVATGYGNNEGAYHLRITTKRAPSTLTMISIWTSISTLIFIRMLLSKVYNNLDVHINVRRQESKAFPCTNSSHELVCCSHHSAPCASSTTSS